MAGFTFLAGLAVRKGEENAVAGGAVGYGGAGGEDFAGAWGIGWSARDNKN